MNLKATKVLSLFTMLTVLVMVWLYPLVSFAQGAAEVPANSEVGELLLTVLKLVFSVLGLLATWLTMRAIGYFEKKSKIDIPKSTEDLIYTWADRGVDLAYEKSHQQLKKVGKKLSGPEKLDIAIGFVNDLVDKYGLDSLAEEKLVDYVDSKLGNKRSNLDVDASKGS